MYLRDVKGVSTNTLSAYATDLKQFLDYLEDENINDFNKITDTRIKAYQLSLKKNGKSNATISRSLAAIRNFILFLIRKHVIEEDPMECIRPPKVVKVEPKIITYEQMKELLNVPDMQTPQGRRDRCMLELLYATGMKASELIQLKVSDINLKFGCVTITQDGHQRVLPLGVVAKEILTEYLSQLDQIRHGKQETMEQEYLFCTRLGNPFTRQGIWKLVKEYAIKAQIDENFSLQTIRNSFAAHMIENGADIKSIQELLGVSEGIAAQRFVKTQSGETFSTYQRTHPRNER